MLAVGGFAQEIRWGELAWEIAGGIGLGNRKGNRPGDSQRRFADGVHRGDSLREFTEGIRQV